jgi:glycosyltransferase involved in cell wall biosynthesis
MISSLRGGGSEKQTLLLLQHLDRSRFTPQLYLTQRAGDLLAQVPDDVVVHSFEDASRRGGLYFPGRALAQQVDYLRSVLSDNAIEVIYDRTFHMTMIAGAAARGSRGRVQIPRVSTIVSPPEHAVPMVERRFVALKRRRLAKAYRQSSSVVAVSRQAAESAERYYGLNAGTVHMIHNAVDCQALRREAQSQAIERDERITFVCVGRMTAEKGHHDLISAALLAQSQWPGSLPGLRLWMVGDGPLRGELESQCRGGKIEPGSIEFRGPQSCPAPFIAAADALVLPSHFEGMPNVVLEAMALGTAVIATRAGGTIELERDQPTILWAEPAKPASLAAAMLQLASDRAAAARRADAARAMVEKHHGVSQLTSRIEQLLAEAR